MVCLGLKPRTDGSQAQTNPLGYHNLFFDVRPLILVNCHSYSPFLFANDVTVSGVSVSGRARNKRL